MIHRVIGFHVGLIQDVAILRPLIALAAGTTADVIVYVSPHFSDMDKDGTWLGELSSIAAAADATLVPYESVFDVYKSLQGREGICIAGSESNVRAHKQSHDVFRALPTGILCITLQHGFECLGFLHNARHTATFGSDIGFAADVIVGWFGDDLLRDLPAAERGKLYVAGPPMMIDHGTTIRPKADNFAYYEGVMCENTHSARFKGASVRESFVAHVEQLTSKMASIGKTLHLRPHPAGQFLTRTKLTLPKTIEISSLPLYKENVTRFSFLISAPSTVLLDFICADVPVAVWQGEAIDTSNFAGLATVDSAEDCWQFALASVVHRESLLERQRRFVASLGIPVDVKARYQALLSLA